VATLLERLRGFKDVKGDDGVIKVNYAYAAFTNDVVMEYALGRSDHRLEDKAWAPDYHDASIQQGKQAPMLKQMYFIFTIMQSIPERLASCLSPAFGLVLKLHRKIDAQIVHIKKQPRSTYQDLSHPTLFNEILSSHLPESDKSVSRLKDEAIIIIGAGTLTSSWTLSVATYHLLAQPEILKKLKTELHAAVPNRDVQPIPLAALEKCQYLVAVVQEAIRLSYGVAARLQRISPDKEMIFRDQTSNKDWVIPIGTPVGMTSMIVHKDPFIFSDPHSFRPERWIENPRLDRFLVSFSKGSRQCLGINLAYAEIYLCLFAIFSRFGSRGPYDDVRMEGDEGVLELFETGVRDVEVHADAFVPLAAEGSQGIRIKVRS
jgi:cytochrome P450